MEPPQRHRVGEGGKGAFLTTNMPSWQLDAFAEPQASSSGRMQTRQRTPCLLDTSNTQTNVWVLYKRSVIAFQAFSGLVATCLSTDS